MPEGITCPTCRQAEPPPGSERHAHRYPVVSLEPVYPIDAGVMQAVSTQARIQVNTALERIRNNSTYSTYWNRIADFQLTYNGQNWRVSAEADTMTGALHAMPGEAVPSPPQDRTGMGHTGYSTCQLCGHYPCRYMFYIRSPTVNSLGRWIGDECISNYITDPETREVARSTVARYRTQFTNKIGNLTENIRRIVVASVWLRMTRATLDQLYNNGYDRLDSEGRQAYWKFRRQYNQVNSDFYRMLHGSALVGREKYQFDTIITGRNPVTINMGRNSVTTPSLTSHTVPTTTPSTPVAETMQARRQRENVMLERLSGLRRELGIPESHIETSIRADMERYGAMTIREEDAINRLIERYRRMTTTTG